MKVRALLGAFLHTERGDGGVIVVLAPHPRPIGGLLPVARLPLVDHQPHHLHRVQPHLQARLHPASLLPLQALYHIVHVVVGYLHPAGSFHLRRADHVQ